MAYWFQTTAVLPQQWGGRLSNRLPGSPEKHHEPPAPSIIGQRRVPPEPGYRVRISGLPQAGAKAPAFAYPLRYLKTGQKEKKKYCRGGHRIRQTDSAAGFAPADTLGHFRSPCIGM